MSETVDLSASVPADARMPVLYLGHGAPPLADDAVWTRELANWSADLPAPTSILMVSAHWESAPLAIGATTRAPLTYDFWGFPQHYYEVTYPAPGAPALAGSIRGLLGDVTATVDVPDRGLDHGAYVPLVEMYPAADIPTLQISMPTLDPAGLFELGARLAPLREEGVLIVGSGFATHNLNGMIVEADGRPQSWSSEFDHWVDEAVARLDVDALLDFENRAPAATIAHPRTEHFAPLFVSLGAALGDRSGVRPGDHHSVIDGFWHGLSKRSWQFD